MCIELMQLFSIFSIFLFSSYLYFPSFHIFLFSLLCLFSFPLFFYVDIDVANCTIQKRKKEKGMTNAAITIKHFIRIPSTSILTLSLRLPGPKVQAPQDCPAPEAPEHPRPSHSQQCPRLSQWDLRISQSHSRCDSRSPM